MTLWVRSCFNVTFSLSIVLPAYNEAANIEKSILACLGCLQDRVGEIIIVDDGSTDNTAEIVDRVGTDDPRVRLISHSMNKGYGAALKTGFVHAKMEYLFFTDSDLQFNMAELEEFLPFVHEYDIVVGFRENRADPLIRKINALGWRVVNRLLFNIRLRDLNCAFKLFRRSIVNDMQIRSTGACVNAEIIARAMRKDYSIKEIPVTHYNRPFGQQTGANPKVILNAFYELGQVYFDMR